MFIDRVRLFLRAGAGGPGAASMRREPHNPKGGPDGGDGGRGGDVIVRVDTSLVDLARYVDHPHQRARSGSRGSSNNRHGSNGADLVLPVPDGTLLRDDRGLLADLVGSEASAVVARGGRGGRGNASLVSARNRLPRTAERGEPGEELAIELELRVVADVGLIGAPNAGKSTLLAALTAARPKIADYPFTTLTPNLGVAGNRQRFVLADVPGLIEGAYRGRGLGLEFLRHVSRCRVLILVVDLSAGPPEAGVAMLRKEMAAYDPDLAGRRWFGVGTKLDLAPDFRAGRPPGIDLVVSAVTGEGLGALRGRLEAEVARTRVEEPPRSPFLVIRPGRDPFVVRKEGAGFRVSGPRVERWVEETDLDDPRQVRELQKRLLRAGVERRLAEAGARRGQEILIAGVAFEFVPEEDVPSPASFGDTGGHDDEA